MGDDADDKGTSPGTIFSQGKDAEPGGIGWWPVEPDVGRVADGISCRVDRIRGLGNAVVPAQAREAFKKLVGEILD
jgi:DNA (cytosine-5)-methyltransferase 1